MLAQLLNNSWVRCAPPVRLLLAFLATRKSCGKTLSIIGFRAEMSRYVDYSPSPCQRLLTGLTQYVLGTEDKAMHSHCVLLTRKLMAERLGPVGQATGKVQTSGPPDPSWTRFRLPRSSTIQKLSCTPLSALSVFLSMFLDACNTGCFHAGIRKTVLRCRNVHNHELSARSDALARHANSNA